MSNTEYALKKGAILRSPRRNYVVDSVLGVGGFGITYKVTAKIKIENIEVKNQFAIKEHFLSDTCERNHATGVISFSAPSRRKVEQSKIDFLAEANRLNGITHPNIVAVNEVFEANDTAYYVMEYIDGKSLRHYIENNGVLSEKQALAVMTPIFNAINYLHSNRLTHLDIKPDNVMMRLEEECGELVPVLIDFGLSKHYDENGHPTSTIRIQGCSQGYAPVEQYLGINSFSPTADVYALGATLYFLLVGVDPTISSELNREELVAKLPASLSEQTRNAICNAMKMTKADRTQSIPDFASELGISLSAVSTSISASNFTQQIKKKRPKKNDGSTEIINPDKPKPLSKWWILPVLIALVFVLSGVGAWLFWNNITPHTPITDSSDKYQQSIVETSQDTTAAKIDEPSAQPIEVLNTPESSTQPNVAENIFPEPTPVPTTPLPEHAVDLGLSVYWADCNVGASSPSGSGNFISAKKTQSSVSGSWSGWRVPTKSELDELNTRCSWSWTSQVGVKGYKISRKGQSIFLPAAGYKANGSVEPVGSYGGYWCSTSKDQSNYYALFFNKGRHFVDGNPIGYAFSLRLVKDKNK